MIIKIAENKIKVVTIGKTGPPGPPGDSTVYREFMELILNGSYDCESALFDIDADKLAADIFL